MAEVIEFPISAEMFFTMFSRPVCTNLFYCILAIRLYHNFLSQLICRLDTALFHALLMSDFCRYQTRERKIAKFYSLASKYLIIQLTKLQGDILNLNFPFRYCEKIPTTFEQGCIQSPVKRARSSIKDRNK